MSKYCYAIVNEKTGALLLEDCKLPIYWNKRVAKERCSLFAGFIVEKVLLKELHKFILTFPY